MKRKHQRPEWHAKAQGLYEAGIGVGAIARQFGVTFSTAQCAVDPEARRRHNERSRKALRKPFLTPHDRAYEERRRALFDLVPPHIHIDTFDQIYDALHKGDAIRSILARGHDRADVKAVRDALKQHRNCRVDKCRQEPLSTGSIMEPNNYAVDKTR